MDRQKFLKAGLIGAAAVSLATTAIAQGTKQLRVVTA